MDSLLFQAAAYLAVGVIAVPIAKRLGLGSVLGYLAAGMLIGRFVPLAGPDGHSPLQQIAEFGVVMMLFIIGLELEPRKLWEMRDRLVGLGGLQLLVTGAAITGVITLMGRRWEEAVTLGGILALSSTAIVLQTLNEKGWMQTEGGRSSFAVLLFQDIAVIPIIAVMPLLGAAHGAGPPDIADEAMAGVHGANAWVSTLPAWLQGVIIVGAIAGVIFFGRYLTRPAFRFIASSRLSEIFTAAALLLVVAIAALMTFVGLSPALGAFVAGVVLADSEFRHELESDIEPFRGLLMGLFFITVGAGIRFDLFLDEPVQILLLALALVVVKAATLTGLGRLFGLAPRDRLMLGLGLAQTGEFGFVLLNLAVGEHVMPQALSEKVSLVVAISMLLTPLLFLFFERWLSPFVIARAPHRADDAIDIQGPAIIAGIGRFGQIVNRLLTSQGFRTVVIDHEEEMVDTVTKFEQKAFYGDASRPQMLEAAGIARARLFVLAIDDRERAVRATEWVKRNFPHVHVIARAFDRMHYYELREAGADTIVRELLGSSLQAAELSLKILGVDPAIAARSVEVFRQHDEETLEALYQHWERGTDVTLNPAYVEATKQRARMFNDAMQLDREAFEDDGDPTNELKEKNAAEA